MKVITLLFLMILSGCASMDIANDENLRTRCPIGYHLDQVNSIELFRSKKTKSEDSKTQDSEAKSRFSLKLKCVSDSDQNEFFNQHN